MMRRLRQTWEMLGRDIFVGERFEKNIRSIRDMSEILMIAGMVMFVINVFAGAYLVSLTSLVIVLAGIGCFLCVRRRNRTAAMLVSVAAIVLVFTYDIFFVPNGFAFLWTMLVPLAISCLFSVRVGILVSVYFWLVFLVGFYSPVRHWMANYYSQIIMARFPVLYLFHIIITSFVMIQYHKSVLDQIDYNRQMQDAKEAAEQARHAAEVERESAQRANVAKSDFLANMSHEIRTPINAVLGMNEMVLRESVQARDALPEDPDAVRAVFTNIYGYAGNIGSAGNNLLAIINDILDFSKIESGRMELVNAEYKLSSVLNDVSNMVAFKARDKGLVFGMSVDAAIPDSLCGDQVRIRQMITNILNNAVKYTRRGGIRLSVEARMEDGVAAGKRIELVVAVQDTGIGIRREDLGQLFTKFGRVDIRRNSNVEGTGLGLAITKSLADMMGGAIDVDSAYGKGSTFTLTIPQVIASPEPIGNVQAKFERFAREARVYGPSFRAPGARILAVDDTEMNLTVVKGLLARTEVEIETATDGETALALTRDRRYDLILMDQRMPRMDGSEALRCIRAQRGGANAETPVICLTADAVIGAKERYITEGFTDYLTKPIDSQALEQMLRRYLPADKLLPAAPEASRTEQRATSADGTRYAALREAGISPEQGLRYCQDDDDLYRSVLAEYADSAAEKAGAIRRYYAREDWKNYSIFVHALKSTSKTIGAQALSEAAARAEAASRSGDRSGVKRVHDGMMAMYDNVVRAIIRMETDDADADDSGVLEFLPES